VSFIALAPQAGSGGGFGRKLLPNPADRAAALGKGNCGRADRTVVSRRCGVIADTLATIKHASERDLASQAHALGVHGNVSFCDLEYAMRCGSGVN
jgi:hypothetical protein